ncbi:MAG: FISUMP domain-containing protein [Ignavibacteria bacterium]
MKKLSVILLIVFLTAVLFNSCKKDYVFDSPYDPDNKLGAPTDFTVTISADTMAAVNWKYIRPDVAFVFTVEISGDGNTWQKLGEVVKVTTLTAKYNFQAGKTYSFRVQAAADQNRSEYGITQAAVAAFGAPSELTVSFPADTMAVLTWKDNSSYETGFEIERSADGLNYSLVKTADANTTSAGIGYNYEAGKTYSFRVRSTSAANKSGYSNTVNWGLIKPAAPDLASPDDGVTDISESPTLIWKPGGDATSYKLEVAGNSSFTNPDYSKNVGTATSQTVSGLSYLTPYYWRVTALNRYGESPSVVRKFTTREPPFTCGKSTVTYSGKTYNTVQIGNQCWLKENLDVGTMVKGSGDQTNNGTTEKYCYDDKPSNCATYGGLYQWDEAMGYSTTAGSKGICPTGWHIPTDAEFATLASSAGNNSNALKAVGQGNASYGGAGTNTTGFSALLAGYRYSNGSFYYLAYYPYYWSSTKYDATTAYYMYLSYNDSNIYRYNRYRSFGFSVRCLED